MEREGKESTYTCMHACARAHTHTETEVLMSETICRTFCQKIYGGVKKSMVGGYYNAGLLNEVEMIYTSATHSGQS
jgi:hypothetical protein